MSMGHHDASRLLRSSAPVYGGLGELLRDLTCRWQPTATIGALNMADFLNPAVLAVVVAALTMRALVAFYYRDSTRVLHLLRLLPRL
ncbi:unnamed protein product (plasmid) [Mycetohabitans rhizoxinica HKI 454]|uniref:Uncharacterized protein n=1 Tax=Mycetohabitans rhizoxinica (strain DSM 19002 / CIP 109453 / HKI 454) TaxID=882378 RepID=E5AV19_MYCRK|nr:unnamed protein product [Mycetohabitans rhizoxinica HKI 454]